MVKSFILSGIPRMYFGCGSLEKLPEILREFGDNYLCITGASSFASNIKGKNFFNYIETSSSVIYRGRIIKEPSPVDVDEIVQEYRGKEIDAVIAIGGGSVVDAGKAISAMLPLGEPVKEYLEGVGNKKHPGYKIPFIAIPTTAGTGSETTINAVISEIGDAGFKRSLRHSNFLPDIAIIDPELTFTCPADITAASGMDALSQLIESYVSTSSNTFTDSLAFKGIELILKNLEKCFLNGQDKDARSAMSYAAMISGITLANAGLGVVHGFASSIGGFIDIPHGALCGTLVGAANRINVEKMTESDPLNPALMKYASLGKMISKSPGNTNHGYALEFVSFLEQMIDNLHIMRLKNFGLKETDFLKIVLETSQKNNPVKLTQDDLMKILRDRN